MLSVFSLPLAKVCLTLDGFQVISAPIQRQLDSRTWGWVIIMDWTEIVFSCFVSPTLKIQYYRSLYTYTHTCVYVYVYIIFKNHFTSVLMYIGVCMYIHAYKLAHTSAYCKIMLYLKSENLKRSEYHKLKILPKMAQNFTSRKFNF